jgi:hypothetical protein
MRLPLSKIFGRKFFSQIFLEVLPIAPTRCSLEISKNCGFSKSVKKHVVFSDFAPVTRWAFSVLRWA